MKMRIYPVMLAAPVFLASCGHYEPAYDTQLANASAVIESESRAEAEFTQESPTEAVTEAAKASSLKEERIEESELPYVEYPEGAELEHHDVTLCAEPKEIMTDGDKNEVHFLAETAGKLNEISLIDADTGNEVCILKDGYDGIAGDGQFTCVYTPDLDFGTDPDVSEKKEYRFCALMPDGTRSETVTVTVYEPFSEKELKAMDKVNEEISKLMKSEKYKNMPEDEKVREMGELLSSLEAEGLIETGSICFTESSCTYSYRSLGGACCGVRIRPFSNREN